MSDASSSPSGCDMAAHIRQAFTDRHATVEQALGLRDHSFHSKRERLPQGVSLAYMLRAQATMRG